IVSLSLAASRFRVAVVPLIDAELAAALAGAALVVNAASVAANAATVIAGARLLCVGRCMAFFSLVDLRDLGDGYGATRRTVRAELLRSVVAALTCAPAATPRGESRAQRRGRIDPVSTRSPDEAGLPPARCRVTVKLGYSVGGTPAHSVTLRASLNVPTGTRT